MKVLQEIIVIIVRETRRLIEKKWDKHFKKLVKKTFRKLESEVMEHNTLMKWVALRVLLPLIVFYVVVELLFFNTYIIGSIFLGALFFVYSNFLPDLDSLITVTTRAPPSSLSEKYALLFFAPVLVYYAVSGEAKPIYSRKPKEFHSVKALIAYTIFLLVLGFLFWPNSPLRMTMLPLFGGLGYLAHLVVDGCVKW